MLTRATAPREPATGRTRMFGFVSLGAAVGTAFVGLAAISRAVPREYTPRAGVIWTLVSVVLLAVGAALWLLSKGGLARSRAAIAAAAGLVVSLLATLAISPALWRSISGHPDNSPADFYQPAAVSKLVDRLVGYAGSRAILGIYLSNHYESSVIVPLTNGPSGSTGGEIISVLPDGGKQVVQTKLSPGIATAEGVDATAVDPEVLARIVIEVRKSEGLTDRDEVRVQVQRRDGATTYEVMARKGGKDQPWQRFDLAGDRLPLG